MTLKEYEDFDQIKVINLLKNQEIVAIPTETVYGLFGIVTHDVKIKINNLKKRDPEQPLQVFFPDLETAFQWIELSEFQKKILLEELPSNKSFLLKLNKIKGQLLKEDNILIRVPKESEVTYLIDLLRKIGPLYATSANLHQEPTLENYIDIKKQFKLKYVIKGKIRTNSSPSKIISLLNDEIKILRK